MKRFLPILLLLLPLSPASAYTAYKTVSFGPTQTAQTVTYTVVNSANTTVSAGVSGAVIELGGGAYASAITVPDGANYFVVWSETNSGTTYTASDKIDAQATAALATLANQTSIITTTTGTNTLATGIKAKTDLVATNGMDSPNEVTAQGLVTSTSTQAAKIATNAMDSPNEITSQGQAGTTSTAVAALPAAVWTYTASDGLTHQQSDALRTAILTRGFSVSYNATTRTQVTTYFKADNTTALATTTVVYDLTGRAVTRTTAFTNLP